MTGQIIEFPARASETEEWITGRVRCLACCNEWIGVAPAGTVGIECPRCGMEKGVFRNLPVRIEEPHYQCSCGSASFSITPRRVYCINCGRSHRPFDPPSPRGAA